MAVLQKRIQVQLFFFARTVKGKGFGADQQIGESTCECCRTDIFTDQNGRIHVAYRDITFPASVMGKQLRDMSYSYSDDLGKTFSRAKRLSEDNWAIEGCPHTGPSLATNEQGLHVLWFTAGGGAGVYYTRSANYGDSFFTRESISQEARHPQLITLADEKLVMVWDETTATNENQHAGLAAKHQHGVIHGSSAGRSKIMLQLREADQIMKNLVVSEDGAGNANHPVALPIDTTKVLIAWVQENTGGKEGIYFKVARLK